MSSARIPTAQRLLPPRPSNPPGDRTADTNDQALVLGDAELAALLLLVADPQSPALAADAAQTALIALRDAGVLCAGVVAGWATELLAPIVAPRLSALVQIHRGAGLARLARLWSTGGRAAIARDLPDGRSLLRPLAPVLIAAAAAVELGLSPRPSPCGRAVLAATEAELSDPPPGPLAELLTGRRGSWRLTVDRGTQRSSLAVLDGGVHGLWLVDLPVAPGPGVTLRPTDADTVAAAVRGMLSPGVDERDEPAPSSS